jgi:hypothetical protein
MLRRLWLEWTDETSIWLGNPCHKEDMKLFVAATSVTLKNGENAKFWTSPWWPFPKRLGSH